MRRKRRRTMNINGNRHRFSSATSEEDDPWKNPTDAPDFDGGRLFCCDRRSTWQMIEDRGTSISRLARLGRGEKSQQKPRPAAQKRTKKHNKQKRKEKMESLHRRIFVVVFFWGFFFVLPLVRPLRPAVFPMKSIGRRDFRVLFFSLYLSLSLSRFPRWIFFRRFDWSTAGAERGDAISFTGSP